MNRASALMMIGLMAIMSSSGLLGCGQDDSKRRTSVAVKRPKPLEDMTPAERAAATERNERNVREMWIWPDGDPPHDPVVDSKACGEEFRSKRQMQHANPLVKLTWLASCMRGRGWELNPEGELAAAPND